jgi:hypothetical protein
VSRARGTGDWLNTCKSLASSSRFECLPVVKIPEGDLWTYDLKLEMAMERYEPHGAKVYQFDIWEVIGDHDVCPGILVARLTLRQPHE